MPPARSDPGFAAVAARQRPESGELVLDHIAHFVDDLEAAHERLLDGGFDVSELRTGRKPGSRVFTIRNGTLNVPTLFISHDPK